MTLGQIFKNNFKLLGMNFRRLTIWTLVFMTSGLVCLLNPDYGYGKNPFSYSRQKLLRMSHEDNRRRLRAKKIMELQSGQKSDSSFSSKFRLRFLTGSISSGTTNVSNSTNTLIWNSWGIGQSVLKYNTSKSNTSYDLKNTSTDLSYTLGDEWTLTFGLGSVSNGNGTITTSSREYKSSNVSGSGYFGVFGMEIGIFEVLVGYRNNSVKYTEFQRDSSGTTVTLDTK
ncbi:MAG: hypothetical protein ACJ0DI_11645 [bacterium]